VIAWAIHDCQIDDCDAPPAATPEVRDFSLPRRIRHASGASEWARPAALASVDLFDDGVRSPMRIVHPEPHPHIENLKSARTRCSAHDSRLVIENRVMA
jgi:hypothetical protein